VPNSTSADHWAPFAVKSDVLTGQGFLLSFKRFFAFKFFLGPDYRSQDRPASTVPQTHGKGWRDSTTLKPKEWGVRPRDPNLTTEPRRIQPYRHGFITTLNHRPHQTGASHRTGNSTHRSRLRVHKTCREEQASSSWARKRLWTLSGFPREPRPTCFMLVRRYMTARWDPLERLFFGGSVMP